MSLHEKIKEKLRRKYKGEELKREISEDEYEDIRREGCVKIGNRIFYDLEGRLYDVTLKLVAEKDTETINKLRKEYDKLISEYEKYVETAKTKKLEAIPEPELTEEEKAEIMQKLERQERSYKAKKAARTRIKSKEIYKAIEAGEITRAEGLVKITKIGVPEKKYFEKIEVSGKAKGGVIGCASKYLGYKQKNRERRK